MSTPWPPGLQTLASRWPGDLWSLDAGDPGPWGATLRLVPPSSEQQWIQRRLVGG